MHGKSGYAAKAKMSLQGPSKRARAVELARAVEHARAVELARAVEACKGRRSLQGPSKLARAIGQGRRWSPRTRRGAKQTKQNGRCNSSSRKPLGCASACRCAKRVRVVETSVHGAIGVEVCQRGGMVVAHVHRRAVRPCAAGSGSASWTPRQEHAHAHGAPPVSGHRTRGGSCVRSRWPALLAIARADIAVGVSGAE